MTTTDFDQYPECPECGAATYSPLGYSRLCIMCNTELRIASGEAEMLQARQGRRRR